MNEAIINTDMEKPPKYIIKQKEQGGDQCLS